MRNIATIIIMCALLPSNLAAEAAQVYFPWGEPDNNRLFDGSVDLGKARYIDVELPATPEYVTGTSINDGPVWVVTFADGGMATVELEAHPTVELEQRWDAGFLPVVRKQGSAFTVLDPATFNAWWMVFPMEEIKTDAYVNGKGQLKLFLNNRERMVAENILYDTTIISMGNSTIGVLSSPDTRYRHGILGDTTEALSFTIMEIDTTTASAEVSAVISAPDTTVFETLAPVYSDINGDGEGDILITASDASSGARILAYTTEGKMIAQSDPIGTGYRWLHLLSAGPYGEDGSIEVVVVRTPHIGGVLQYYRLSGNRLVVEHQRPGFSTHRIGSRNLWMFAAGDFDGDPGYEVLLPDQSFRHLHAVKRTKSGSSVVTSVELPGRLTTNIAATVTGAGNLVIAAGTDRRILRVWGIDL